jgi:hypothetical protein
MKTFRPLWTSTTGVSGITLSLSEPKMLSRRMPLKSATISATHANSGDSV